MKKVLLSLLFPILATTARADTYQIDPVHSSVEFRIHHLVGNVKGSFDRFQGTFDFDPAKPANSKASAGIAVSSIDTHNSKRDGHLQSPDFFDAAKCSTITFVSNSVTNVKGNTLDLNGDLTIHCITKPVTLHVEIGDIQKGPDGKNHAGMSASTKINRKDFGMVWNKTLDSGGLMIGEEVQISIDVEGVAQK